jgi:hypothetical protein
MLSKLKATLSRNVTNALGWHTNRKIVVFESDDWGSIRSTQKSLDVLSTKLNLEKDYYARFDSLESKEDLLELYKTLSNVKDKSSNHPVITANTILTNPNFKKIREDKFEKYYFELFTETLEKYYPNDKTWETWQRGINEKFIKPQFHGREHVNIKFWMEALRSNDELIKLAFDHEVFGVNSSTNTTKRSNYMATFDFNNQKELKSVLVNIEDGLDNFNDIFGFTSKTMIAPCYVWSDEVDDILVKKNVLAYQGIPFQYQPQIQKNSYKKRFHYTGQTNSSGVKHLVRNAFFEPTHFGGTHTFEEIMKRAESAFFWKKPLIIGAHRINFMGSIYKENRTKNLELLELTLKKLITKYPDIEFMSSDQLVELMLEKK